MMPTYFAKESLQAGVVRPWQTSAHGSTGRRGRAPGPARDCGTASPATRPTTRSRSPGTWSRCTPPTRPRCSSRRGPGCADPAVDGRRAGPVRGPVADPDARHAAHHVRRAGRDRAGGAGRRAPRPSRAGAAAAVRSSTSPRPGCGDGGVAQGGRGGDAARRWPPAARRPPRSCPTDEPRLRSAGAGGRGQGLRGRAEHHQPGAQPAVAGRAGSCAAGRAGRGSAASTTGRRSRRGCPAG